MRGKFIWFPLAGNHLQTPVILLEWGDLLHLLRWISFLTRGVYTVPLLLWLSYLGVSVGIFKIFSFQFSASGLLWRLNSVNLSLNRSATCLAAGAWKYISASTVSNGTSGQRALGPYLCCPTHTHVCFREFIDVPQQFPSPNLRTVPKSIQPRAGQV